MVHGLPQMKAPLKLCKDCLVGKQQCDPFPKKSTWRASQVLQLVHADICGPIKPVSNSNKRYLLTFIDDYNRKLWVYFLTEKSEAFAVFKKFKANVENETGFFVKILHTDRAGEFTSQEFNDFYDNNGIKRQLTAAYTPQQNGIAECKNRTIMNMVRSMLSEKKVPNSFWLEAVNWTTHVLNRGISEESKAYRIYDPISQRIIISRDVVFEEDKQWEWEKQHEQSIVCDLEWEDDEVQENNDQEPYFVPEQVESDDNDAEVTMSLSDSDSSSSNSSATSNLERTRMPPVWMNDYGTGEGLSEGEANMVLYANIGPIHFEDAVKDEKWRQAMDVEMEAIKKKWHMGVDRFAGRRKINWSKMACMETIRLVIALAAQKGWPIYQFDVKSAFLPGELTENVFVEQPCDFKRSMKIEFDMTGLGRMKYFLGLEIFQNSDGIFLSQRKYALEVLQKFGMHNSTAVYNPIVPGVKLVKDESGATDEKTYYKQIVGSLMYLTATRPDMMFTVSLVSRYMDSPTQLHFQAAKRVLRYLKGTTDLGIFYKKGGDNELIAYADSDYAGDLEDRKSTSGYLVVSLSTTEAKFISAASCACQAVWLTRILKKLDPKQDKSVMICCDNNSAIKLLKNPMMHGRSKHIDVRFHFLRELTKAGTVELVYCASQEQLADIMSKALKLDAFLKLRALLGICSKESVIN
ncbi:uncharacterized protein LOC119371385 [Jatropha curcas]|uniref:uncharacterized protein LOC119371385 n=1 Tax=Jatropha curcas TaxID=180498 RepID=UPI0018951CC7|nr:uncharacterized protein LOC119371385 [Jatropha curcas]